MPKLRRAPTSNWRESYYYFNMQKYPLFQLKNTKNQKKLNFSVPFVCTLKIFYETTLWCYEVLQNFFKDFLTPSWYFKFSSIPAKFLRLIRKGWRARTRQIFYTCTRNVLKYLDFIFYVATTKNNKFDFGSFCVWLK